MFNWGGGGEPMAEASVLIGRVQKKFLRWGGGGGVPPPPPMAVPTMRNPGLFDWG